MLSAFLTLSMVHHYGYVAYAEEESGNQPEVTTVEEVTTEVNKEEATVVEVETTNEEIANTEITVNPEDSLPIEEDSSETTVENQPVAIGSWMIDAITQKGEEILEKQDSWIHFKSSSRNGNSESNASEYPAVFVSNKEFNFNEPGSFEVIFKTLQENGNRFGFYLGYKNPGSGMFFGYDAAGWYWQKYGAPGNPYYTQDRKEKPVANTEVKITISWNAEKQATLKLDDEVVFENEEFSEIAELTNQIAMKAGSWGSEVTDVYLKEEAVAEETHMLSGRVVNEQQEPLELVEVSVQSTKVTTSNQGEFSLSLPANREHEVTFQKDGYVPLTKSFHVLDEDLILNEVIVLQKEAVSQTSKLHSSFMDVEIANDFPRVIKYELKEGDLKDKVFYGQEDVIRVIRINDQDITLQPQDVTLDLKENTALYTMKVAGTHVDATIKAQLVVDKDVLSFEIVDIVNHLDNGVDGYPIQTIEIPNHYLISIRSNQQQANLKGATMSSKTITSGDEYYELELESSLNQLDYMYAFISNHELSASLWSNSEHEGRAKYAGVSGGSHNTRVVANTTKKAEYTTLGLSSAKWYYHRVVTDSHNRRFVIPETEMPKTKIIITGNRNDDPVINWQDGAIAFRKIMNNPYKSEEVPELVAWRIAMNFGGQAQNPFLVTLDNVKRVALHTDGLGQSVLLKGYGSEGHDSGHPDYANIGMRIGGAKDMNFLMENGKSLGARFGIHVNAGEMYPEAQAFTDDSVRRDARGNLRYGWNWIDQGVGLDSVYDLATGNRKGRFDALKEKVGDNMDFVYVDIWGNQTGGSDDSWQTRKLSKEINDNGWRMTTEWGSANEYDSTFQHWATDLTYGGYALKGENSTVMRFLRNHQKDSWVGDYPAYGGAAMAPLLGGYNMKDFEGWQGRNDYDSYITNLYTHNVTTKFIQHFKVVEWQEGQTFQSYLRIWNNSANRYDMIPYAWTPEMRVVLKDDYGNTLELIRKSDDPTSEDYRHRTMILNGKVIAEGAPSSGARNNQQIQNKEELGTEKYLIPWNWDRVDGQLVEDKNEKLYHWNTRGGESQWELPESWKSVSKVKLYKLTSLGKEFVKDVVVNNGLVILDAESEVPYVLYKEEQGQLEFRWSEGMHIVDAGFNSGNLDHWKITNPQHASIAKSQHSNPMLKLSGEATLMQELTDLKPNTQYAVLIGVDNRSDQVAKLSVFVDGKEVNSNYTTRSIAKNYVKAYTHSTNSATVDGTSYFQNMYVYFTTDASGKATLQLSRAAGDGDTYFDDIRIVENEAKNIEYNEQGEIVKFTQDFEHNVQGIYPFVIGSIENVEDNRIHLSELHAPYTQAGWDVKEMDDVLDGNWSVKVNGLTGRSRLAFQTIPQTFRFEAGEKYRVTFDYQAGSDNTYAVIVGSGEFSQAKKIYPLQTHMGKDQDGKFEIEIIGDETGQTWFGIYSTNVRENIRGLNPRYDGNRINFSGYKDLVIDNVVIERVDEVVDEQKLRELLASPEVMNQDPSLYDRALYKKFENARDYARLLLEKDVKNPEAYKKAYNTLVALLLRMETERQDIDSNPANDIPLSKITATAGNEEKSSVAQSYKEGVIKFAFDNDTSSKWHTNWTASDISTHWVNMHLSEPTLVNGVRVLQRVDQSRNGRILKAKVLVKTDGDGDYVEYGPFILKERGWTLLPLPEIEHVVDVKLVPVETSGERAQNQYSSAAEIRLTTYQEIQLDPVDKTALNTRIAQASRLEEWKELYSEESYRYLEEKIAKAQEVSLASDAKKFDVLLALVNLEDGLKQLKKKPLRIQGNTVNLSDVYSIKSVLVDDALLRDIKAALSSEIEVYDIEVLKAGVKVDVVDTEVTVTVKKNKEGTVTAVRYINPLGQVEDGNYPIISQDAQSVTFTTTHLSMYALVYQKAPLKPSAPSVSSQVEKKPGQCEQEGKVWSEKEKMCVAKDAVMQTTSIPKTGDTTNTTFYVVIGVLSLLAVVFVLKKKYQK